MTTLFLLILTALLIGTLIVLLRIPRSKSATNKRLKEIKARAAARANERAFADTESESDPYSVSLELSLAMSATEVDDRFDGRGDLTEEQMQAISLIFDGFKPVPVQEPKNMSGITAHAKAGIPWSQSVFDELNQIEPIAVDDIWNSKYNADIRNKYFNN